MSHAAALALAERRLAALDRLAASLGTSERPGGVWTHYRQARLRLGPRFTADELAAVLAGLEAAVLATVGPLLLAAAQLGVTAGIQTLALVDLMRNPPPVQPAVELAREALQAQLAAQHATLVNGYRVTDEVSLILGDAERVGALSPAAVLASSATWLTQLEASLLATTLSEAPGTGRMAWQRQAIATLGSRTTDCCLRVHGQIVALNEPFRLTGTPRFADEMHHPPFHWGCRTVEAYVPAAQLDDALTQEMRRKAARERAAREQGGTAQRDRRSPTARRS